MTRLATIANWIVGCLVAATLALAPSVPAFAACPPATMEMGHKTDGAASAVEMPCDMPCADCPSKTTKTTEKPCADKCVGTLVLFAFTIRADIERAIATQRAPHVFVALATTARPPDTPPPKHLA